MKTKTNSINFLKKLPPFDILQDKELERLEKVIKLKKFKPHEIIFRRSDYADAVYIIVGGEVAIQAPAKSGIFQTVSTIGKNSFFGEMSVLTSETRSTTAVTTQPTTVISIDKDNFLKILHSNFQINNYFQKLIASRVVSANEQVAELVQARDITGMQIIKEGNAFMAYNRFGDISANNAAGFGFYKEDTRYLSLYDLFICGERPVLLRSSCDKNFIGETAMTNPPLHLDSGIPIPQNTFGISRKKYVISNFREIITIKNFSHMEYDIELTLNFASDFRDIFEIRGLASRIKRGKFMTTKCSKDTVTLPYKGLDKKTYYTKISFSPKPGYLTDQNAKYKFHIKPKETISVECGVEAKSCTDKPYFRVVDDNKERKTIAKLEDTYQLWRKCCSFIKTDHEIFNLVLKRCYSDLRFLQSNINGKHKYYDAGTPWYSCLFGRDSIIASLQTLILNKDLPESVLGILAKKQGKHLNISKDEEPGKILHELRTGELANAKEIPHTPYYGNIDGSPLWIILFSELYRWSGSNKLLENYWENAISANKWIDKYGDFDNDGYFEYKRKTEQGLRNQGWKDSDDAILEKDGTPAKLPIALVEVQGYVYDAKLRLAEMASRIGDTKLKEKLLREASLLHEKFTNDFWVGSEKEGYLAIALNGSKQKVESVSSNQGHALWSGILNENKAKTLSKKLLQEDMFSGWGIRTLSSMEAGYNPFGYHLGTVWPHDNAIIAAGLKKYGLVDEALKIFTAISGTARFFEDFRLPELFCGFSKKEAFIPVQYPLACRPQAWAAGSIFMFVHSMLGFSPDPQTKTLVIDNPVLPGWFNWLEINNLTVFGSAIDLRFERKKSKTTVKILKNENNIAVEPLYS